MKSLLICALAAGMLSSDLLGQPSIAVDRPPAVSRQLMVRDAPRHEMARVVATDIEAARAATPGQNRVSLRRQGPAVAWGKWVGSYWRLSLRDPGAAAIQLHFQEADLGGGQLWLHSPDGAQVLGPYSGRGDFGDGDFWTGVMLGDSVDIEYEAAAGEAGSGPRFEIAHLEHFWRFGSIFSVAGSVDQRLAIDTSCFTRDACRSFNTDHQSAQAASVFLVVGGSQCSGTMVKPRVAASAPLLVTNQHCIGTEADARQATVVWGYQYASCSSELVFPFQFPQRTGGVLLGARKTSGVDLAMVALAGQPFGGRAGWTNTGFSNGATFLSLSHPRGVPRAVATVRQSSRRGDGALIYDEVSGYLDHGSSGSGVFDSEGRLVSVFYAKLADDPDNGVVSACSLPREQGVATPFSTVYTIFESFFNNGYPIFGAQPPPVAAPAIGSFTASPTSIVAGGSSVLRWAVTGTGATVTISGIGTVSAADQRTVTPAATTTYTLSATNAGGTVQASATVTVNATAALVLAAMSSPAPGATLPGACTTFRWTAGSSTAREYYLEAGPTEASKQYADVSAGSNLAREICGLPTNGSAVFVRLWTKFLPDEWRSRDYRYQAATVAQPSGSLAVMTAPAAGSQLPGPCATFRWSPGSGAREYFLEAGPAEGSTQFASVSAGLQLTRELCGFPANGSTIFVRLWTKLPPDDWRYNDYRYQTGTATQPQGSLALMSAPANGSTLPGACATFRWTAGANAQEYYLEVGPVEGSTQYASVSTGLNLSRELCGLPANGSPIFVRLWTKLPPEDWRYIDYRYQAASATQPVSPAAMTAPVPNGTLPATCATFRWSAANRALEYHLDIGSSQGAIQYASVSAGQALAREICGLPTNASPVFVRLWTLFPGDDWRYNDYRYQAAGSPPPSTPATLRSPSVGSLLNNTCADFAWNPGTGASEYRLSVGSLGADLKLYYFYNQNLGSQLAVRVCSIPQVGGKVYVHLVSNSSGLATVREYIFATGTSEMYFSNGDFEGILNPDPGGWITLRSGAYFGRWIVGGHSVDIHDGRGNNFARSGRQSVDLSGEAAGSILQTIATQPGQKYRVTFWYAGHPYHPYAGDAVALVNWGHRGMPDRQGLRITRPASASDQKLNWTFGQFDVTAEFGESFLTFTSHSPNGGIVLDDVRISPIN